MTGHLLSLPSDKFDITFISCLIEHMNRMWQPRPQASLSFSMLHTEGQGYECGIIRIMILLLLAVPHVVPLTPSFILAMYYTSVVIATVA